MAAFACSVIAMTISTYVNGELVKRLNKGSSTSTPAELRAVLLRSKAVKGAATIFINICMAAHVPSTYIYEWFCAANLGPHAPRGTTWYSVARCEDELGRSVEYCERWRDEDNATMTLLFEPPDGVCPSIGLCFYNAVTQYCAIGALALFVATLHLDLRYAPPEANASPARGPTTTTRPEVTLSRNSVREVIEDAFEVEAEDRL